MGAFAALLGGCSNDPPSSIVRISAASPVVADGTELAAVKLPHRRSQDSGSGSIVAYRLTVPAAFDLKRGLGVFVTVSDVPGAVGVNETPVFQNGDRNSSAIQISSWRASPTFRVAPSLLRPDKTELLVHV